MLVTEKNLLLTFPPNDFDTSVAVSTWTNYGYNVLNYTIADLRGITDKYLTELRKYKARPLFYESAWGNIPSKDRDDLFIKILKEPLASWLHVGKRNDETDEKNLLFIYSTHDQDIEEAIETWKERGYIVNLYPMVDLREVQDSIIIEAVKDSIIREARKFKSIRPFFFESTWSIIPHEDLCELHDRLLIEPEVYWTQFSKK